MKVIVLFLAISHICKDREQIVMISPYGTCHTISIFSQKFTENSQKICLGDQIRKPKESKSSIQKQISPLG